MSETELLRAFREHGSEDAFARLVRHYAGLVYSVAKRRLGHSVLAEDITQIVFIRLARTPPIVRTEAELAAWLHRTTRNVTVDAWRSEMRRRAREQHAAIMEAVPHETSVWEEIAPNLDEALDQLDEEDRHAVVLRFFGSKSMRDVGTALGVSEDAAKMRVSRAVDRLRKQLGVAGGVCTAAGLGTMLGERSAEAAPPALMARLALIKLPVGAAAGAGLLRAFGHVRPGAFAASAVVLIIVGIGVLQILRSSHDSVPTAVAAGVQTPPATHTYAIRQSLGTYRDFPASQTRGIKLRLHVIDSETGMGIANANVHFAYFGVGSDGEGHNRLTDENGDAPIPEPDDPSILGAPNIFVTAEGYVPKALCFSGGMGPADYTMKLGPAMTVGGLVVDEQGAPVAGVIIRVQSPGIVSGQIENVDFQTSPVTNKADGSWTCSYIPRDYTNEITFILKKPGYATTLPHVPVEKVNLTNLILVLNRGFVVTGQITDLQGGPIADARLRILDGDSSKRQSMRGDENGMFTFTGVAGEADTNHFYKQPPVEIDESGAAMIRGMVGDGTRQAEVVVQARGFAPEMRIVELSNSTNVVNFKLAPGKIFQGRVVDESGNPIPNAVAQTDWDNQGLRTFVWTTRTDSAGRFEWDSAPEGPQLFWFEANGYNWRRDVSLVADGTEHEIRLKGK